ncbi:MAG: hypothetical protein IK080_07345 [Clostridia bacterium]|nr:hypothetical protein [Clostridia bacterium]
MKYMIKSLSDKITAAIVYLILAELVVAMFLAIDCMADYHFYAADSGAYAMQEALRVKTGSEFETAERCVAAACSGESDAALLAQFDPEISNVVFFAEDASGAPLLSSLGPEETFDPATQAAYTVTRPFSVCDSSGAVHTGTIRLCIRKGLPAHDSYRLAAGLIRMAEIIRYPILGLLVALVLASILVLGLLMSSIGRKSGKNPDAMPERFIDKIPFDALLLIMAAIVGFVTMLIVLTSVADIKTSNLVLWNAIVLLLAFIISATLLLFSITLATRIKYGHVYRNTLIFKAIAGLRKKRGKANEGYFKVPFVGKALITIGSTALLEILTTLYFLFQYRTHEAGRLSEFKFTYYAIFQLLVVSIIGALFFMMTINLYHLRVSSKRLAQGDLAHEDDTNILFGDFREISEDFEDIKDDMIRALEEKTRSTELRNELIANISHDIKTPLTSIINYADIISSGGCDSEELRNYLGVISHQSQKLNGLLQSLIEVSKLNSGNLKATFETLDIVLYLSQLTDEFSPALAEKELEPETDFPEEAVLIRCDSTLLWRVFENLIGNICKYSLPGTRVYIGVERKADCAEITFRNTSAQRITLTEEELLERFRRNDKSRSGGGNGLGLSIAKSFTELQNGAFALHVDGDLFKTTLTFPLAEDAGEEQ